MQADRLLKLAEYLRTVKPKSFNLLTWGKLEDPSAPECGTTACAVGHACTSGIFKDDGLSFKLFSYYEEHRLVPLFNNITSWAAVGEFFDLEHEQALHLFDIGRYRLGRRGPRSVANRIEAFVKRGGLSKWRKEVSV